MLKEHDVVALTADAPEDGLEAGDVGAIVAVHGCGEAFSVEVLTLDGGTAGVAVLSADQVRPVSCEDVAHTRKMTPAAAPA